MNLRRAAAVLLFLAIAVAAVAHEAAVLDLESIEARLYERTVDPFETPLRHAAYSRLLERFGVSSGGLLSNDVKKVEFCARACDGSLGDDAVLVDLTDTAAADAQAALVGDTDDVSEIALHIHAKRKRQAVLSRSAKAIKLRTKGDAKGDAGLRVARLARYRKAALQVEAARRVAAKALEHQRRKPSPGQPLPKGNSGTIDTYVGNGLRGYDGEALRARDTALYWPLDVAVGPRDGLLYVCDTNNHRIRRVDEDGRLRTVVGSGVLGASEGPALSADIHHPSELAFDPADDSLVIAGWHAEVVHRWDRATGTVSFVSGTHFGDSGDGGPVADALFSYPVDVDIAADGTWYVSDQANRRLRRVDGATHVVTALAGTGVPGDLGDGGQALAAQFALEAGDNLDAGGKLCLDPTGTLLYVADTENHRVRRIDLTTGVVTAFAGTGTPGYSGDGGPALAAELRLPVDVDCDAAGDVYVAERGNDVVRRVEIGTGTITTFAGSGVSGYRGDGGPAATARLDGPGGVFVDRERGRVYVADTGNSVVRVIWE